jgi:hypothetical protein
MRGLDWERLLNEHRVPFITFGPNVKRGELAIQCPFCGSADPSKHMGLNLETGWYSCWRNRSQHSGKSPVRLVMRLLRVPYAKAREICGLGEDYIDPDGFDAMAARIMGRGAAGDQAKSERRFLAMDRDFLPITRRGRTSRCWDYLYDRGFDGASGLGDDVDVLCDLYGLRAGTGYWNNRIVIPYYQDGELMTWTGRAIGDSTARYLDLQVDQSILAAKETLFNHDAILAGGKALVLAEGPFDALKLDFYGRPWGVRAVALSTNSISDEQAFLLQAASDKFDETLVMMDNASVLGIVDSMRMRQALYFLKNVRTAAVPFGAKDGGELTPRQITQWAQAR